MPILVAVSLALGGCATPRLPDLYLRGAYSPSTSAERPSESRMEIGLTGRFASPTPPPAPEPPLPPLAAPLGCRVALACDWERRASAEARARVIGAAP